MTHRKRGVPECQRTRTKSVVEPLLPQLSKSPLLQTAERPNVPTQPRKAVPSRLHLPGSAPRISPFRSPNTTLPPARPIQTP
jgi:hypothetical protein